MLRPISIVLHALWLLIATYFFWASLAATLGPTDPFSIVLWPLGVFLGVWHFSAFLLPPVIASFVVTYLVLSATWKQGHRYKWWWPVAVNTLLALSFIGLAETYRAALMHIEAYKITPEKMHTHPLLRSMAKLGEHAPAHAELTKDGIHYIWSYAELTFVRKRLKQ